MIQLADYEVQALVAFVIHAMDMDTRLRLMREFPALYNKLVGRAVVATVHLCVCGHVPEACACDDAEAHAEASVSRLQRPSGMAK